ncbi:MAG: AAA family ATPase [Candidatus Scalindua sp.]|jgi:chromosome partitioning protein|nr:AAA family ATPase [Candidatus Scalindua sp.]MBT6231080.1 AAA family ATPase [Candidatus Scalindua sp.]MBT6564449.1 AAA family ATPase [Candidatus Scalindua sp.]
MKTIAIISQKGGAGKTTLAINLAVVAESLGHSTVIIDLDPQASAKSWHDMRGQDSPVVISAQAARLSNMLDTARKHGAALVIIDTAPHSETAALDAARAADLVLIPCRPSLLDLRAISTSSDLASLSKKPAVAVLNAVPFRGTIADEAEQVIKSYGLKVLPARLGQRAAFIHSLTNGQAVLEYEPKGKASIEVKTLYMQTCNHVGMRSLQKERKIL